MFTLPGAVYTRNKYLLFEFYLYLAKFCYPVLSGTKGIKQVPMGGTGNWSDAVSGRNITGLS